MYKKIVVFLGTVTVIICLLNPPTYQEEVTIHSTTYPKISYQMVNRIDYDKLILYVGAILVGFGGLFYLVPKQKKTELEFKENEKPN